MPISSQKIIVLDVEGTTTSIDFVHKTLFPYSLEKMANYVVEHSHTPAVAKAIQGVKATVLREQGQTIDDEQVIATLSTWIREDRKDSDLKQLQGLIWDLGYKSGDLRGHVYEDVAEAFRLWTDAGWQLGIYSSGSVLAQKLLFAHTKYGDLTQYLSFHFDTKVGEKRNSQSYLNIKKELLFTTGTILFLSDIHQELSAAAEAQFTSIQVVRPGTTPAPGFTHIRTLPECPLS